MNQQPTQLGESIFNQRRRLTDFLEERLKTAEVRFLPGEHTASGSTGAPSMALPLGIVLNFFLFLNNNMEPGSSNRENIKCINMQWFHILHSALGVLRRLYMKISLPNNFVRL